MDQKEKSWTIKGLSLHCFSYIELMNMLIPLWEQSPTSAQKFIRGNINPRGKLAWIMQTYSETFERRHSEPLLLPNACNATQAQSWLVKIKRNWTSSLRSDEFSRFLFMVWVVACWVVLIWWGVSAVCEKHAKKPEEQESLTLLVSEVHWGSRSRDQGLIYACVVDQGLGVLDCEESPLSWRKTW